MQNKKGSGMLPPALLNFIVDRQSRCCYLTFSDNPVKKTIEHVPDGVYVDFDQWGKLVGIEILMGSRKMSRCISQRLFNEIARAYRVPVVREVPLILKQELLVA